MQLSHDIHCGKKGTISWVVNQIWVMWCHLALNEGKVITRSIVITRTKIVQNCNMDIISWVVNQIWVMWCHLALNEGKVITRSIVITRTKILQNCNMDITGIIEGPRFWTQCEKKNFLNKKNRQNQVDKWRTNVHVKLKNDNNTDKTSKISSKYGQLTLSCGKNHQKNRTFWTMWGWRMNKQDRNPVYKPHCEMSS